MFWLFLIYLAVVLFGVKFQTKGTAEYLSIENTQAVKGIFILMVFFSHFNGYITLSGTLDNLYYQSLLGQAMVAMFLFYSGYGVMESIKRKGAPYVAQIPKKRILGTLFNFDCAVVLFVILALILGQKLTVKQVLLSLIGWDSVGNSNWYIFVILVLYALTYLVFTVLPRKSHYISVAVMGILSCVLIYLTAHNGIKPYFWYDTMLCYALGMGYSLIKQYVERFVNRNIVIWLLSLGVSTAAYLLLRGHNPKLDVLANLAFSVAFVVFSMRVTLQNKVLKWCGEHLFEIYILQRIPMIVFKHIGLIDFNVYIGFVASLAVTVGLTLVFGRFTDIAWKALTTRKSAS